MRTLIFSCLSIALLASLGALAAADTDGMERANVNPNRQVDHADPAEWHAEPERRATGLKTPPWSDGKSKGTFTFDIQNGQPGISGVEMKAWTKDKSK